MTSLPHQSRFGISRTTTVVDRQTSQFILHPPSRNSFPDILKKSHRHDKALAPAIGVSSLDNGVPFLMTGFTFIY
ncbi:uncharacterized protein DS421_11g332680 [Arachis hypogaea]|nr:uncharacterized protein DS421_11g332680 [Arachis hypogaea]